MKILLLLLISQLYLFSSCPYAQCTSQAKQEAIKVKNIMDIKKKALEKGFDLFSNTIKSEAIKSNPKTVEELEKIENVLRNQIVILNEIKFLTEKKVKILQRKINEY